MPLWAARPAQEATIPFDDTNYREPPGEPPPPTGPRVSKRDETALLVILVLAALAALLLPISAASFDDVVRTLGVR